MNLKNGENTKINSYQDKKEGSQQEVFGTWVSFLKKK